MVVWTKMRDVLNVPYPQHSNMYRPARQKPWAAWTQITSSQSQNCTQVLQQWLQSLGCCLLSQHRWLWQSQILYNLIHLDGEDVTTSELGTQGGSVEHSEVDGGNDGGGY